MKKIIIEISDSQHEEMQAFLSKCFDASVAEECMGMDSYSLKLEKSIFGSTLDIEMYGKAEQGDVKWHIE
jgi:hypothetical protein